MSEKTITIREFIRNYKKFIHMKKTMIITNHGKPETVIVPFTKWQQKNSDRKFTIEDLKRFSLPGGPPDLSQRIDEVAYPYPNKLKNEDN